MKETGLDFGNEKISTLFKKLFFPTLLGMLSVSAVTHHRMGYLWATEVGSDWYPAGGKHLCTAAYVSYGSGTDWREPAVCYCLSTPFTG